MANRGTSVDGGWKLVSFGLCVFSGSFGVRSIVLCKCSGKYIDIYFILKITYPGISDSSGTNVRYLFNPALKVSTLQPIIFLTDRGRELKILEPFIGRKQ